MLVGETRDKETAHAAVEAALTGHLVFTTLHTNSAAVAFTRRERRLCQQCRAYLDRGGGQRRLDSGRVTVYFPRNASARKSLKTGSFQPSEGGTALAHVQAIRFPLEVLFT
jgi:type II/IV secretion system protein